MYPDHVPELQRVARIDWLEITVEVYRWVWAAVSWRANGIDKGDQDRQQLSSLRLRTVTSWRRA